MPNPFLTLLEAGNDESRFQGCTSGHMLGMQAAGSVTYFSGLHLCIIRTQHGRDIVQTSFAFWLVWFCVGQGVSHVKHVLEWQPALTFFFHDLSQC